MKDEVIVSACRAAIGASDIMYAVKHANDTHHAPGVGNWPGKCLICTGTSLRSKTPTPKIGSSKLS